jgi:hypothetical protein
MISNGYYWSVMLLIVDLVGSFENDEGECMEIVDAVSRFVGFLAYFFVFIFIIIWFFFIIFLFFLFFIIFLFFLLLIFFFFFL